MTVKDVEKICEVCNVINVDEVIKQCARLIDADAAKIRFANYREDCINEDDINTADVFADVVSELDEFPTIDPVLSTLCLESVLSFRNINSLLIS